MSRNRFSQVEEILEKVANRIDRLSEEHEKFREEQEKTDYQLKELGKYLKNLGKQVGDLTGGWGEFIVGLFEPSIEDCIKDIGFNLIRVETPSVVRKEDEELEIDAFAVIAQNGTPYIMVIEVKSYINQQKIEDFINKRLLKFKEFFIDYKHLPVMGAVAGVRYAKGTENKALSQGLYVFKTSKGFMRNITPPGFKPKIW